MKKAHPSKNLGMFLHKPKAKAPNPMAVRTKPQMAPKPQTKPNPKAPMNTLNAKMKIGKARG